MYEENKNTVSRPNPTRRHKKPRKGKSHWGGGGGGEKKTATKKKKRGVV